MPPRVMFTYPVNTIFRATIVGFIPPSVSIPVGRHPLLAWLGEIGPYALLMLVGTVLLSVPPFIFLLFKKPGWKKQQADSGE